MDFNPKIPVDRAVGGNGSYGAMSFHNPVSSVDLLPEQDLRQLIRDAADQLCQVVDGNLDFVVRVSESDDDIDKFLLLVNFVLASARRSFSDLREAHLRIEEDLSAARKLQEKLLPQELPNARNLRVSAKCIPARAVGGDFFDFFRYQHSGLYVGLLADVSGKGAAAAIYAALASGIARFLVDEELNPKEMLTKLNKSLFARAPDGNFVALTYCTWDDQQLVLELSGSGLPDPLLCRRGIVRKLEAHGLPLGLFREADYEVMRIQCERGDTLLFYTDGVVETVDKDGNEFGPGRLCEIIMKTCRHRTSDIVNNVFDEVNAHCNCEMNVDDQTVIAMQVL
jgi:sigma-B regulation protein RsbU (phosphoserine phosphatase)